jgi:hypothetical protein
VPFQIVEHTAMAHSRFEMVRAVCERIAEEALGSHQLARAELTDGDSRLDSVTDSTAA